MYYYEEEKKKTTLFEALLQCLVVYLTIKYKVV